MSFRSIDGEGIPRISGCEVIIPTEVLTEFLSKGKSIQRPGSTYHFSIGKQRPSHTLSPYWSLPPLLAQVWLALNSPWYPVAMMLSALSVKAPVDSCGSSTWPVHGTYCIMRLVVTRPEPKKNAGPSADNAMLLRSTSLLYAATPDSLSNQCCKAPPTARLLHHGTCRLSRETMQIPQGISFC